MFKRRSPDLRLVVKVVSTSLAIAALGCSDQGSIASNQAAIDDATASDEEALEKSRVRAAYIAARQAEALEEPGYHVDLWRNPERPANADRRLVARNPQQRFTSTFGDEGVRIGFAKENWELRFRVVGIACRAGEETPVREVGEPFWSDSNRVEYNRRAGEIRLREWYVNGPLGLEHGVTLPEPPCNGKALGTREIVIAVQMEELSARRAVRDGEPECVELIDDTGEVRLQYSDLYSVDATGKALQARMVAAASNRVEFVVSVEGATYPVVVDPLVWAGERKLIASDGRASDRFGFSASLTADRALVGAYGDEFSRGSAYVLSKSGTSWSEEQKLTASDGAAGDEFGRSVSLTADRALVGVYGGSAYVFSRSGTTWTEEQKLAASDGAAGDQFGCAVSLTADRALVGARGHDSSHGSVYVFSRSGTTWTEEQKLTASDGAAGDQFGCAVSLTADRALVGAYGDEVERGSVYVFSRSGTTWTEEQKLTASDGATRDVFGWSVSLTADRALVGAWGDDSSSGSAYVFSRSDTAWSEEKKLTAGDGAANTYFGSSVSLTADRALVGAHGDDSNRGSAYVFSRSGTAWSEEKKLTASDGTASDYFGSSVSLTTDRALVGATDDLSRRGSAYIYSLLSADGDPCTGDVGCLNGRCVDGVCCNVSCTGSCAACSAATGAATDGICKTFAAGSPGLMIDRISGRPWPHASRPP
jgi:hypothetical protein